MNAIKEAQKVIRRDPADASARTLAELVLSLESAEPFRVERLYALDLQLFDLALQILKEWRIDRYYAGKAKLYDLSMQLHQINSDEPA